MADPLSITASIVAVLQIAGTVVTYLNDVKDASSDRNQILVELSLTRGLLFSLKDLAERPPPYMANSWSKDGNDDAEAEAWDAAISKLGGLRGPLEQYRSTLDKLATKLAPSAGNGLSRRVGKALTWPFVRKEVDDTLKTMERLKSLIVLVLQRDYMYVNPPCGNFVFSWLRVSISSPSGFVGLF
jgi:hypothetical protein